MTRREKIFSAINKSGIGLEIGPSYNPIAPKREGFNVQIIDHLNREGLIQKYKQEVRYKNQNRSEKVRTHSHLQNIEEVDFVWKGESFSALTGNRDHYDWIIASHVIEHTTDLIDFINNCDSVLKNEGTLSLVIPDKKFCFDRFRPITSISKVVDAHIVNCQSHTLGTKIEYLLNTVTKEGKYAWGKYWCGQYDFVHSVEETKHEMNRHGDCTEYEDFHSWVFTPNSFRLLIHDLNMLGLISLKELCFFPGKSDGCEFHVSLSRCGEVKSLDRLKMLNLIERDLSVDSAFTKSARLITSRTRVLSRFKARIRRRLLRMLGNSR